MTEHVILCGEASTAARGKRLTIRLNEPGRNFRLEHDHIARRVSAEIPPRVVDLLEIAAYVFAADQSLVRGGAKRRDWGREWRRSFAFHVPVRDAAFWQRAEVASALMEALSFMSEDDFRFRFVRAAHPANIQEYLALVPDPSTAFVADEVVLFSGGLDSLAGAVETLTASGRRIAIVSHRSAPKILPYQEALATELQKRFLGRVFPIRAYAARTASGDAPETTQRTRSFLYAALGFAAATLFGIDRIRFCENGVVSIHLPISEQIVGTMATRTTHPQTVRLLRELLSLVAEAPVDFANPFVWRTKTEVLESLRDNDAADLIRKTVSCSSTRAMRRDKAHCGRCSQCLDRRFAALAAGMAADDPGESYATDLLTGARERQLDRLMAIDFCRHGVSLATMSEAAFTARFPGELARVREGFPDESADDVGSRCLELFERHGRSVDAVLTRSVERYSRELVRHELPATSLLRLWMAEGESTDVTGPAAGSKPQTEQDVEQEPIGPVAGPDTLESLLQPLQVSVDRSRKEVVVHNVTTLKGRDFDLIDVLADRYREDLRAERPLDDYGYTRAAEIADALSTGERAVGEDVVRQIIRRGRSDISEALDAMGEGAPDDLLIQTSADRRGYRLNPRIRLVAPER